MGGDWYDVFTLPGGRLGVVVGDVAGSGLEAAVIMGRMRSALRAAACADHYLAAALRRPDRKIQYFEPDAMATVLYGLYTPGTGEFTVSSAGHLPPVLAAPGSPGRPLALQPDPPVGVADDPPRRSVTAVIPPGCAALLLHRRTGRAPQPDHRPRHQPSSRLPGRETRRRLRSAANVPPAEDACIAVMRTLIGNAPATDDIAILILNRHPSQAPAAKTPG